MLNFSFQWPNCTLEWLKYCKRQCRLFWSVQKFHHWTYIYLLLWTFNDCNAAQFCCYLQFHSPYHVHILCAWSGFATFLISKRECNTCCLFKKFLLPNKPKKREDLVIFLFYVAVQSVSHSVCVCRNYDIVILAAPVNRDMSHINVSRACPDPGSCPSATADRRRFR